MDNEKRQQLILKAVLLLRKVNRYMSKEEQLKEVNEWISKGYLTDDGLLEWIDALKAPDPLENLTEEERFQYYEELSKAEWDWEKDRYTSATNGDYGPSNPWNAPGMSIHDFI